MPDPKQPPGKEQRDEPVSLAPLDPEEALRALLGMTPPDKPDVPDSKD